MVRIRFIVFATLLASACARQPGSNDPKVGMTRDEFIKVMRELQVTESDKRAAVLKKHRTSEAEIRAFVQALANDPMALSATLDSVQNRVDRRDFFKVRPPIP